MPLYNKDEHLGCVYYATEENAMFRQFRFPDGVDISDLNETRHVLVYVLEGCLQITLGFTPYTIERGTLVSIPKGTNFTGQTSGSCHFIASFFTGQMPLCNKYNLAHLGREMRHLNGNYPLKKRQLKACKELVDYYSALSHHLDQGLGCIHFHRIKQEELCILLRAYHSKEELYMLLESVIDTSGVDFKDFVLQNYLHMEDVNTFASLANMSLRTFQRRFKEEFGQPARKWINERRAECILRDLRNTDKSFSNIASCYGFVTLSYFSTFCKQYFGVTPLELRYGTKQSSTKAGRKERVPADI